jgi:hypothetical protein
MLVLLAGCNQATEQRVEATHAALHQPAPSMITIGEADLTLADSTIVLQAGWGSGAGELGKRDEGARPGPMSLAVADDNSLLVLDQVNRRVVRYAAGQLQGALPIAAETTEDIAIEGDHLWTLVYEPGESPGYRVERYPLAGRGAPVQHVLDRSFQLVTGLFVDGRDVWVEMEHDVQRRVVRQGVVDRQGRPELGRPDRAGRGFRLSALRSGPHQARVHRVVPGDGVYPLLVVQTARPLVGIQALETDAKGRIFLGLVTGEEGEAPRNLLLVADGSGFLVIELSGKRVTEAFRPLAVGPDGSVYELETGEEGVTVRRFALPGGGAQ